MSISPSETERQEPTFSESDIAKAVKRIAAGIVVDYDDLSQLVLVGVMNGAVFLLVDLMRELRAQESGELVQMVTARMESYQGTGPEGVQCISLPSLNRIKARDVLIVDDIVNTGATCACLKSKLLEMDANSVKVCTMLYNSSGQKCAVEVDYCGFNVAHPYWIGYGLDYKGVHRSLPYIRMLQNP